MSGKYVIKRVGEPVPDGGGSPRPIPHLPGLYYSPGQPGPGLSRRGSCFALRGRR
jgi:hypothetical protein